MTILDPQIGHNHQHDQAAPARANGAAREQRASWAGGPRAKPCAAGVERAVPLLWGHHGCERLAPGSLPFIAAAVAALLMAVRLAPRRAIGGEDSALISWKQHVLSDHSVLGMRRSSPMIRKTASSPAVNLQAMDGGNGPLDASRRRADGLRSRNSLMRSTAM